MIAALLLAAVLGSTPPPLQVRSLDGRAVIDRHSTVLLFWRTDCAPCRLELGELDALRRAATPMSVQLVGLQSAPEVRRGLQASSLRPDDSVWTMQDAGQVLVAWGGPPPRLPLAVALDSQGRVCGRRTGLLGTDRLKAWAQACGGRRAAH